jgi:hypothetical protein
LAYLEAKAGDRSLQDDNKESRSLRDDNTEADPCGMTKKARSLRDDNKKKRRFEGSWVCGLR